MYILKIILPKKQINVKTLKTFLALFIVKINIFYKNKKKY